jgi:hypothetical protein
MRSSVALLVAVACSTHTGEPGVVGPAGGTIESNGVTIVFPPGALATGVKVTVDPTTTTLPPRFVNVGPAWALDPAGTQLAAPATVTFSVDTGAPADSAIYRIDQVERRPDSRLSTVYGTISATIWSLGPFGPARLDPTKACDDLAAGQAASGPTAPVGAAPWNGGVMILTQAGVVFGASATPQPIAGGATIARLGSPVGDRALVTVSGQAVIVDPALGVVATIAGAAQPADVDGNGVDEAIVVEGEQLEVFDRDGTDLGPAPLGGAVDRIVTGDLDGDGAPDAIVWSGGTARILPSFDSTRAMSTDLPDQPAVVTAAGLWLVGGGSVELDRWQSGFSNPQRYTTVDAGAIVDVAFDGIGIGQARDVWTGDGWATAGDSGIVFHATTTPPAGTAVSTSDGLAFVGDASVASLDRVCP